MKDTRANAIVTWDEVAGAMRELQETYGVKLEVTLELVEKAGEGPPFLARVWAIGRGTRRPVDGSYRGCFVPSREARSMTGALLTQTILLGDDIERTLNYVAERGPVNPPTGAGVPSELFTG